jgi:ABC-type sugar transport system substrate-binding protein
MKKKLLSVLLAAAMGLSLMACGGTDTASDNSDAAGTNDTVANADADADTPSTEASAIAQDVTSGLPEGAKIGFSTITLGSEFFSQLDDACREYFEAAGYEMITVSCEGNSATQISDIENLISMNCDAIVLFASDPAAIEDVCATAVAEGIKVYPIATSFSNRDAYTYIQGTNQYDTGVNCAEMASRWIDETFPDAEDGSIEVAIIGNTQGQEASDRTDGMYTLADINSKVKIVEMFDLSGANDSQVKAQEYADTIYTKYPDCKVVLAYGVDSELGANERFMANGVNVPEFAIFGVDTSEVAYQEIQKSITNESCIRGTVNLGDDLALNIFDLLTGAYDDLADENGMINTPSTQIDASNISDYVQ